MKNWKRFLALALCCALLCCLVPCTQASAEIFEDETVTFGSLPLKT